MSYAKPIDNAKEELSGKKIVSLRIGNDMLVIETEDKKYVAYHDEDCCETVYLVSGPYELGSYYNAKPLNEYTIVDFKWYNYQSDTAIGDCEITGIFLQLQTGNYARLFRFEWIGESNGYYATGVDLYEVVENKQEGKWYRRVEIKELVDAV